MSYFTIAGSTYQSLLSRLKSGQSGRLVVGEDDSAITIYVQQHTLLYAVSSVDDAHLVRRLHVAGLVNRRFYDELLERAIMGESIFDTLYSNLPESALELALNDRFKDNLTAFIASPDSPRFSETGPDFVNNMQMVSEWSELLEQCAAVAEAAAYVAPNSTFTRGAAQPSTHQRRSIRAQVRDRTPLQAVLECIPLEPMGATALLVQMVRAKEVDCTPALYSAQHVEALYQSTPVVPIENDDDDDDAPADEDMLMPVQNLDHIDEDESITLIPTDDDWIQAELEGLDHGDDDPNSAPPKAPINYTDWMAAVDLVEDDELAAFSDNESDRSAGSKKGFSTPPHQLDSIDVSVPDILPESIAKVDDEPLETEEASASYSAPEVEEDEAILRINRANERLAVMAGFLDKTSGQGAGRSALQLLVDSTGPRARALFSGIQLKEDGTLPMDALLDNLYERPTNEHFQLVSTGLINLIERALSAVGDELPDDDFDDMYEAVAGYRQALGV